MKRRFRDGPLFFLLACFIHLFCASCGLSAAETAVTEEVYDGDTIRVRIGHESRVVRLIGINAPERSHPTKGKEYYGDEAAAYLSSLCLGKTVRLEKGEEETDRYHRLLRYVYLPPPDNRLLNIEMLRAGMARAYTRFPFSLRDEFVEAEAKARGDSRGLWKNGGADEAVWLAAGNSRRVDVYPASDGKYIVFHENWFLGNVRQNDLGKEISWVLAARAQLSDTEFSQKAGNRGYRPLHAAATPTASSASVPNASPSRAAKAISWEEAGSHVNKQVLVEGVIVRTHRTATQLYLNFHTNWKRYLTLVIHEKDIHLFPPDPEKHFKGKNVRASGEIVRYNGRLEMTLRNPTNLVITP